LTRALWLAGLLWAAGALAEPGAPEQLRLLSEHPVEGIAGGNLSGLAQCGEALLAVSDREDDRLYRLNGSGSGVWQAEAESFRAPPAPC